jgi:hypothetical protein
MDVIWRATRFPKGVSAISLSALARGELGLNTPRNLRFGVLNCLEIQFLPEAHHH